MKKFGIDNYINTFSNKEFGSLLGKGKSNLIICSFLLSISMCSIAFSLGAFKQLKDRMDNPYTNWVTLPVLFNYRENIPQLLEYFQKDENKDKFGLKSINYYVKDASRVYVPSLGKYRTWVGRSIDFNEEITSRIFHHSNILSIIEGFDLNDQDNLFRYFITESFCAELNMTPEEAMGSFIEVMDWEENDKVLLFEIGGVLRNLPNHASFIVSEELTNLFRIPYEKTGFVHAGQETKFTVISAIDQSQKIQGILGDQFSDLESEIISISGHKTHKQTYFTNGFVDDSLLTSIRDIAKTSGDSIAFVQNWNKVLDFKSIDNPMYISFNFKSLDKIRELQAFLKDQYQMEIELSMVEERDNFSMVSRLAYFTIISIIFISLLSFSIFLYNLIRNHFEKIKANIGTFMAFGMPGREIKAIYRRTVFVFLVYSWVITFFIFILLHVLITLFSTYEFALDHPVLILTFIIYNLLAFYLTNKIVSRILAETPGDLIYNRV